MKTKTIAPTAIDSGCFLSASRRAGGIGSEELEAIDREVGQLIDEAVVSAKAAPLPIPRDLVADVYVSY